MMYMPSVFGENLFDDFFDDPFFRTAPAAGRDPLFGKHGRDLMKTDIREVENGYELDIDLAGFKKDEIHAEIENGYLTVSAAKGVDKSENDKKGRLIRQERYTGSMKRTFYVGEAVKQEDISAKFEDGILKLCVPKKEIEKEVPQKKYISIEG